MLIYLMIKLIQLLMRVHRRLFCLYKNNKHMRQDKFKKYRSKLYVRRPFTNNFEVVQGMHIQTIVVFNLQRFFLSTNKALEKVLVLSIFYLPSEQ